MAISTGSPQIKALKDTVEKRFGRPVRSRSDYTLLATEIERTTHEHIAENTLRRIWGGMKGYDTVYKRTLDVLCRFVGFEHWDAFADSLKSEDTKEFGPVCGISISASELVPGDRIRLGWLPDRMCMVEFVGGHTFKALDCRNSILQAGDTFECSIMIKHYPLFADNLVHGGELCQRYSIGLDSGLTTLEKL